MGIWRRWKLILVATIAVVSVAALLLPALSFADDPGFPMEHWVRRPDLDHTCGGSGECYQMCIDFQGAPHPMPNYECF